MPPPSSSARLWSTDAPPCTWTCVPVPSRYRPPPLQSAELRSTEAFVSIVRGLFASQIPAPSPHTVALLLLLSRCPTVLNETCELFSTVAALVSESLPR